jgi:hypothetical protein
MAVSVIDSRSRGRNNAVISPDERACRTGILNINVANTASMLSPRYETINRFERIALRWNLQLHQVVPQVGMTYRDLGCQPL